MCLLEGCERESAVVPPLLRSFFFPWAPSVTTNQRDEIALLQQLVLKRAMVDVVSPRSERHFRTARAVAELEDARQVRPRRMLRRRSGYNAYTRGGSVRRAATLARYRFPVRSRFRFGWWRRGRRDNCAESKSTSAFTIAWSSPFSSPSASALKPAAVRLKQLLLLLPRLVGLLI